MKLKLFAAALSAALVTVTLLSCGGQSTPAKPVQTLQDTIERGRYLVTTMGCGDCHSPKVMGPQGPMPDESKLLSGHPANMPLAPVDKKALGNWVLFNQLNTATVGPWGASFAANLTSDETGIGNWSEEQFLTAMKKGKYKGMENSRPLLPPMPWQNFAQMSNDDLRAMFAFLKSTKPVRNVVPAAKAPTEL